MATDIDQEIDKFRFRNLHPKISIGTASDRYAGWIGQIYSKDRYENKIKSHTLGKNSQVCDFQIFRNGQPCFYILFSYASHFS